MTETNTVALGGAMHVMHVLGLVATETIIMITIIVIKRRIMKIIIKWALGKVLLLHLFSFFFFFFSFVGWE